MKYRRLLTILATLLSGAAFGCSPLSSGIFKADAEQAKAYEDPRTGYAAHPPAPEVLEVDIERGTGSDGYSCADAGTLTVELRLPKDSPFTMADLGFYFRVVSGEDILVGHRVPLMPVASEGRRGSFILVWMDGAPADQQALDLEIEVFALSHDLEIGPPTRFKVQAGVGG